MKTYEKDFFDMGSVESGGTYDLLLFNNATKHGYVYRNLYDSGEATYYQFNFFNFGDIPTGEYSYALIPAVGYRVYAFKDNLLDTQIGGEGGIKLKEYQPVVGLLKYVEQDWEERQKEPTYRDTDKEFFYRRKNS